MKGSAIEQKIKGAGGIGANLAPDAFNRGARHYYKCKQDFQPPDKQFSPVPYFLLCRAIELALKAKHLHTKTQQYVRREFGHNLIKSYINLPATDQILSPGEGKILLQADDIYADKDFEYFNPEDALTALKRYPKLDSLDAIARKLIGI